MYLSPPNSNYQWTSRNFVFTNYPDPAIPLDCICQASPVSFDKFQMLPKFQKTLYTLNKCGLCLSTNLLSRYNKEVEKGKETTMISH